MRSSIVRGLMLTGGLGVTLVLGLWADASPRRQDEFAAPKPTPEHLGLRQEEGMWDAAVTTFMPGADGKVEEMESRGMEMNRMMPGGLWLISTFRGDFGGMPFHGHGVTGYDTQKKKFVGTWVDSISTSLMVLEGTYEEATKTATLIGDTLDPQGKPTQMKIVEVDKDEDHRVSTMFMKAGDEWQKSMEIRYTRREGPPPPEFGKEAPKKEFFKKEFDGAPKVKKELFKRELDPSKGAPPKKAQ